MGPSDVFRLRNDQEIPALGLGTYQLRGSSAQDIIIYALNNGYRHIDTAAMYQNEEQVGRAVFEAGVERDEIWITTKVWTSDLGYESTKSAFKRSMDELQMDYIDLYLIHWPGSSKEKRLGSWQRMLELQDEDKIKTPGVSNFSIDQLFELKDEFGFYPCVNQVKFSPFHYKPELLRFCNDHDIVITAYTPLNKGNDFNNTTLMALTRKYDRTPAQIMLRWAIDKGVVVIPKTSRKERIEENAKIFDFSLNSEDIEQLDAINK
jgi:diketogulonate reductase-like aldo/keto reductase